MSQSYSIVETVRAASLFLLQNVKTQVPKRMWLRKWAIYIELSTFFLLLFKFRSISQLSALATKLNRCQILKSYIKWLLFAMLNKKVGFISFFFLLSSLELFPTRVSALLTKLNKPQILKSYIKWLLFAMLTKKVACTLNPIP